MINRKVQKEKGLCTLPTTLPSSHFSRFLPVLFRKHNSQLTSVKNITIHVIFRLSSIGRIHKLNKTKPPRISAFDTTEESQNRNQTYKNEDNDAPLLEQASWGTVGDMIPCNRRYRKIKHEISKHLPANFAKFQYKDVFTKTWIHLQIEYKLNFTSTLTLHYHTEHLHKKSTYLFDVFNSLNSTVKPQQAQLSHS